MSRPTPEQLDRYMDLVVAGEDPADAIEVIWDAEPEPVVPPKPKKPTVMVTEFDDGVLIGWDRCTTMNGGCGEMVSKCACKNGPREPRVFAEWRTGAKIMPDYGKASVPTSSTSAASSTTSDPSTPVGVKEVPSNSLGQVPCREGKHLVALDKADRNDDGTYTCHECQEAGLTVARADEAQA